MKKLFSFLLILSLSVFTMPPLAMAQFDDTGDTTEDTGDTGDLTPTDLADLEGLKVHGCSGSDAALGGAFTNMAGSVLGSLGNLTKSSARVSSGDSTVDRLANGAINTAINFGLENLGDIFTNLDFGSFLEGGLGGIDLGGLGIDLGGIVDGLGGLSGLAGGAGSIVGSFLGGGNIPVDTVSADPILKGVQSLTNQIKRKDYCLDAIQYKTSQLGLAQLTKSTMDFINTGYQTEPGAGEGEPLYVVNEDDLMGNVKTEQLQILINDIRSNENLSEEQKNVLVGDVVENNRNASFDDQITPTLAREQQLSVCDGEPDNEICGLNPDDPADAQTIEEYSANNFSWGGFLARFQPNNSGQARKLITKSEEAKRVSQAAQKQEKTLDRSGGFRNVEVCVERDTRNTDNIERPEELPCLRYETKTPASIVQKTMLDVTGIPSQTLLNSKALDETLIGPFQELAKSLLTDGLSDLTQRGATGGVGNGSTNYNNIYARDLSLSIATVLTQATSYRNAVSSMKTEVDKIITALEGLRSICSQIPGVNSQAQSLGLATIATCESNDGLVTAFSRMGDAYGLQTNYSQQLAALDGTNGLIAKLTNLRTRANNARSIAEVNTLTAEYTGLSQVSTLESDFRSVQQQIPAVQGQATSLMSLAGQYAQSLSAAQAALETSRNANTNSNF